MTDQTIAQQYLEVQKHMRDARSALILGVVLFCIGICLTVTISAWWLFMAVPGFLFTFMGLFSLVYNVGALIDLMEMRLRREFGVMAR